MHQFHIIYFPDLERKQQASDERCNQLMDDKKKLVRFCQAYTLKRHFKTNLTTFYQMCWKVYVLLVQEVVKYHYHGNEEIIGVFGRDKNNIGRTVR